MDVRLRRAAPADEDRLRELLRQLGYQLSPAQVAAGLVAPGSETTVAEADGDVVGVIVVTTRHAFHHGGPVATIDTLVVDQGHRSRGVGERLVADALTAATSHGAVQVEVQSHVRRTDARRFYERVGFTVTGNSFTHRVGG